MDLTIPTYIAYGSIFLLVGVVFAVWLRRLPDAARRYCLPVVLICFLAAASKFLSLTDIGLVTLSGPGNAEHIHTFIEFGISYGVIGVLVVRIADGTRRQLLSLLLVIEGMNIANAVTNIAPESISGITSLISLVLLITFIYILFRPVYRSASSVSEERRLLFWKARNLLVFSTVMLVLSGLSGPTGTGLFDQYLMVTSVMYAELAVRAGFGFFLFFNIDTLLDDDVGRARQTGAEPSVTAAD